MHRASGLLHNLTASPLIVLLTVRLTSPEDGHITGLCYPVPPRPHLSTGAAPPLSDPKGGEEGGDSKV
ncbi:hypothetical protein CgunFtcFv8_018526 [Champsocephalus gunnari]|uniref:Secreted protein n=1 Tax=Champsocephalus gunnari TaxID=52237 RepID=A0AAN8BUA8_CHAGU|nr:hypothetical protein CgunFtcFv8_018526 [Champsocephalus gunnari]